MLLLTCWYLKKYVSNPPIFLFQLDLKQFGNLKHPHIYKMVLSRAKHCQSIISLVLDHFESGRNEVWELKKIEKQSKCFQPVREFEVISCEHDLHSVYHHWVKFLISICCTWKWEFQFPKHWCLKLQWRKS